MVDHSPKILTSEEKATTTASRPVYSVRGERARAHTYTHAHTHTPTHTHSAL